ncbi:MAG TPA: sulfotransferase [Arenimonas sp.]|nr:sulfotransferase [Arenimonas sp.]
MPEFLPPPPSLALAYRAFERGDAAAVLDMAERAERAEGPTPTWKVLKAVSLSALQRPLEALEIYRWLCASDPHSAAHWSNLGNCLCELERQLEALEPLQKALLLGATDPAVHFGLARAYAADGPLELARRHIETAIARAPHDAEFHLFKLRILQAMDRWPQARRCADYLQSIVLDEGQGVDFGYLLFRGQWYEEAIARFLNRPADPDLSRDSRIGLVMAYERTNRLAQAKAIQAGLLEQDVRHNPKLLDNFLQMQAKLAMRGKEFTAAKGYFERILNNPHNDPGLKLGLEFEYAAALDKCREPAAAMTVLQRAHSGRRLLTGKNHPALQDSTDAFAVLEQPVPPWNPACQGRDAHADPVFVVGFPRSGTTLLEQLLDAHPALASFDEQPFLQHIVHRLTSDGEDVFERIRRLTPAHWLQEREAYFAEVRQVVPDTAKRAVDKNPLNMVRLPLLQNFFPASRVILAVRHPCDVVLSCYMQHFRAPAFALTFETLESTARMYGKVFSHWQQSAGHLQLPVLQWKYEELVADTEAQARALFDFLQLPWHDELLAFTERAGNKGAIKTPSYTQVVERVNAGSVGRWQAYADWFTPAVLEPLKPWLERFGYSA